MGRQIIKQPDGKLAIWSSIVDDFVYTNLTAQEYINIRVSEERVQITQDVKAVISKLEKGTKPYFKFTMSYAEALSRRGNKGELKSQSF